jgi:hypothetical protein
MPDVWTPIREGPHEAFVDRLHRTIAHFAETMGVEKPVVEIELADTGRFTLDRIEPEPGFGLVTIYVHTAHQDEGPDAIMIPIGTIRRIELRRAPDDASSRFGFTVPETPA